MLRCNLQQPIKSIQTEFKSLKFCDPMNVDLIDKCDMYSFHVLKLVPLS